MLTLIINYWWFAIVLLAIAIICFSIVFAYVNLPHCKKAEKVKEWLLYAVVQAEKELGSGTGQLKLRYVYNLALSQFPIFIKIIPFEMFSKFVDGALKKLEDLINNNESIKEYMDNK